MDREIKSGDEYLDKLYKLLPAETTAAYLAIRTLISPETTVNDGFLLFFAIVILVLSPILYVRVLHIKQRDQVAFLTFSYVVWAANIDVMRINSLKDAHFAGNRLAQFILDPIFIKGFLVIWVILLVPMVLKKPETP
ncbi:MAG: hypothetical protein QOF19_1736 [Alphaproteobacteria bacterium]|jgi:hypothetical protein|nr:hypothetical protein [Alphaproteobacteria bacterium]